VNRFKTEETFGSFSTLESDPSIAFLAFRGTMTTFDWIKDFSVAQKQVIYNQSVNSTTTLSNNNQSVNTTTFSNNNVDNIQVHEGFLSVYDSMRKQIYKTLLETRPSILYITGHSLGAAMCFVAAADLASQTLSLLPFLKSIRIYPFASPRPGNNEFATLLQTVFGQIVSERFHLANTADITVDVPLSVTPNVDLPWKPLIYTHVDKYIPFTINKGLVPLNHHFPTYMEALRRMFVETIVKT
jgi:predicted lipase